jgi:hypothetical protein
MVFLAAELEVVESELDADEEPFPPQEASRTRLARKITIF